MDNYRFLAGNKEAMFDDIASNPALLEINNGVEKSVPTDQPLAPSTDITPVKTVNTPMSYESWRKEFGNYEDLVKESEPTPEPTVVETEPLEAPVVPAADKYSLTFSNEIGRGRVDSRELHHPTKDSGVTIGPGYDLSHRESEQIVEDLTSVGVPKGDAERIAQGAGLTGDEATNFADSNDDIELTDEQEKALFDKIVPEYEERAQNDYDKLPIEGKPTFEELPDEVKTLLLDYSYNVGVSKFPKFFTSLIKGDKGEALKQYKRYASGKPLGRRNKDTLSFLEKYDFKDLSEGDI